MADWKGKSVWSVLDNFAQQALSFGIFAMLARLLSPTEFGLLAIAHLVVQFVRMTVFDALAMPVLRSANVESSGTNPFDWLFSLCALTSLVLATLMALTASQFATWYGTPELRPVFVGMSLVIILYGLVRAHEARLLREGNFRLLAIRSVVSVGAGGAVALVLARQGAGAMALVGQQIATGLVALVIAVSAEWRVWRPRWVWSNTLLRLHRAEMGRVCLSALLSYGKNNIDVAIVSLLLGSYSTGLYNLAKRVTSAVFLIIGTSLGRVGVSQFVQEKDHPHNLRRSYLDLLTMCLLLMVPIYTLAAQLAEPLVSLAFGPQWLPSAALFGWLGIAYVGQAAFELGQNILFAKGMIARLPRLALMQLLLASGGALGLGYAVGLPGVVAGFSLGSLVGTANMQWVIGRQLSIDHKALWQSARPAVLAALCAATVVRGLQMADLAVTGWPSLVATGVAGLTAYAAVAVWLYRGTRRF
jgi:O-antigen/teichoic acid export membrane protein